MGFFEIAKAIEQKTLSVTDTESKVAFFYPVQVVHIKNVGDATAYIELDGMASTDKYPLTPGEAVTIFVKCKEVHAICDTGYSTTLKIVGMILEE